MHPDSGDCSTRTEAVPKNISYNTTKNPFKKKKTHNQENSDFKRHHMTNNYYNNYSKKLNIEHWKHFKSNE